MAKRQIRIANRIITQKWPEISGKKANIVLTNGTVFFATLDDVNKDHLVITNMRLKKHTLTFSEISEIIIDY